MVVSHGHRFLPLALTSNQGRAVRRRVKSNLFSCLLSQWSK
jgi:hypothetical protein